MPRGESARINAAGSGVVLTAHLDYGQKCNSDDYSLDICFPEMKGETLFQSSAELFSSTLRIFSKMLQRIRKSGRVGQRQSLRRGKVHVVNVGRKLRLVSYREGRNTLAAYETVLYSLLKHGGIPDGGQLTVSSHDFLGWERQIHESLTMVLAADVSRSTLAFKEMFAQIIQNLSAHFNRHRDRIGLISISGQQAEILNHPSRNHRVVAKSMLQLEIKGETPLGDGMITALEMVKMEHTRNPGSKPLVILLSDCFPEPLTHKYDNIMDEPMYIHALNAAEMYRRKNIPLLLINPSYRDKDYVNVIGPKYRQTPGEKLSDEIVRRSKGRMIKLKTSSYSSMHTSKAIIIDREQQIKDILNSIESAFTGRQNRSGLPGYSIS